MQKPFNDRYEVVELQKVNRGLLKAYVTFRSLRSGRRLGRGELWADKLAVWVILAGEEDLGDPEVLARHIYESTAEKLRLTTNHSMKQFAMRRAICQYLGLPDATWCLDDDDLRAFLCSKRWKKWTPSTVSETTVTEIRKEAIQ